MESDIVGVLTFHFVSCVIDASLVSCVPLLITGCVISLGKRGQVAESTACSLCTSVLRTDQFGGLQRGAKMVAQVSSGVVTQGLHEDSHAAAMPDRSKASVGHASNNRTSKEAMTEEPVVPLFALHECQFLGFYNCTLVM
jgi:hypothetical protein